MHVLSSMLVKVKREAVLSDLKKNLARHKKIVKEANIGYVEKTEKLLNDSIKQLKEGKILTSIYIAAPIDNTKTYETAIRMLEIHTDSTIELNSEQVKTLCMDEWDWTASFLMTNSVYSATAASMR